MLREEQLIQPSKGVLMKTNIASAISIAFILAALSLAPRTACCGDLGFGAGFAERAAVSIGYEPGDSALCVTNAGYAGWKGSDTIKEIKPFAGKFGCSLGDGNLYSVHSSMGESLWFVVTVKSKDGSLRSVCGSVADDGSIDVSKAVDVTLSKSLDYSAVKESCGNMSYSAVGYSNTWSAGAPWHLTQGALFHNHFCPGVTSGYIIAKWLLKNAPLEAGESYNIIGLPHWCKEDSLMSALDVTPGKGGYFATSWTDEQKRALPEDVARDIAGFYIKVKRENRAFKSAKVLVLGFDFHKEEFFEWVGENKHPELSNLQLALWAFERLDRLDYFVSVIKEVEISDEQEYERLLAPGGDPLKLVGLYK